MAEEHSEQQSTTETEQQSTTETAASLPFNTNLANDTLRSEVTIASGDIALAVYDHDTALHEECPQPREPTADQLECVRANTLGYFKSQWTAEYPAKEGAYLSEQIDRNTTCCGVNVIEIGQQISKYNANLLNSPWKICCCFPGSFCYYLCHKKWLLAEQCVYILVFFGIVFITAFNEWNLIPNVITATNNLGTLVAFLLGLYVSLSISRWWRLRADGIGNIWGASQGIATLLGPMYEVYRDKVYSTNNEANEREENENKLKRILIHLKRIQRYCQLSMAMVFNANKQDGFDLDRLEELEIIAREDRDAIERLGSRQEYTWSLVSREVRLMMHECPCFMDQSLILTIQEMITIGVGGAALISAQLGSQLPLTYAHGVTLIAKVYNIVMCITSGIQFVDLWLEDITEKITNHDGNTVAGLTHAQIVRDSPIIFGWSLSFACSFLLVRTSVICMLLHLCQQLANPFDNDTVSFPGFRYVKWVYLDFEILLGFDIKKQWTRINEKLSTSSVEQMPIIQISKSTNIQIPSTTTTPYTDSPTISQEERQSLCTLTPKDTIIESECSTETDDEPTHLSAVEPNATIVSSILNLVLSVIGAGTLTIPYAVAQIGFLCSAILFMCVAVLNILTLNLNMECAKEIIPCSYNALCMSTVPRFKQFVDSTVIIATFGILCVYLVVIGDLLPDIVYSVSTECSELLQDRRIWITLYLLIFIVPTACLKEMNHLRFTSFFAILCYLYIMAIIVMYAVSSDHNPCRDDNPFCRGSVHLLPTNYLKIFKVIPFYVQIYSCHFNACSICNELKNCNMKRLNVIASSAIFISMLIYVAVGYGAYMTYGDTIHSNIILKYPHTNSLLILRVCLSIAIAFGYPVIMQSTRNCLSNLFFKEEDAKRLSNLKFYGMTYVIVAVSFVISMITEDITDIFGIVGSTASILVVFIFPALFYYNFEFQQDKSNKCKKCGSIWFIVMGVIFIPFCIVMQFVEFG